MICDQRYFVNNYVYSINDILKQKWRSICDIWIVLKHEGLILTWKYGYQMVCSKPPNPCAWTEPNLKCYLSNAMFNKSYYVLSINHTNQYCLIYMWGPTLFVNSWRLSFVPNVQFLIGIIITLLWAQSCRWGLPHHVNQEHNIHVKVPYVLMGFITLGEVCSTITVLESIFIIILFIIKRYVIPYLYVISYL